MQLHFVKVEAISAEVTAVQTVLWSESAETHSRFQSTINSGGCEGAHAS